MRKAGLAFLLCALLLTGCRQAPTVETETPSPTPTATPSPEPTMDLPVLEPWQEAYRDILLYPEEHEELYAVADPDDDSLWIYEWKIEEGAPYLFSICDLDEDDVPELLLGYEKREYNDLPRLLLNILYWNGETGTVEDMDGPRTYGLMDTLWFYENGYLGTQNAVSSLYTVYWKLEDSPGHYWSCFERGGPDYIEDSDKEVVLAPQEFYAMLGERMDTPTWQEISKEAVEETFLLLNGEGTP